MAWTWTYCAKVFKTGCDFVIIRFEPHRVAALSPPKGYIAFSRSEDMLLNTNLGLHKCGLADKVWRETGASEYILHSIAISVQILLTVYALYIWVYWIYPLGVVGVVLILCNILSAKLFA